MESQFGVTIFLERKKHMWKKIYDTIASVMGALFQSKQSKEEYTKEHDEPVYNGLFIYSMAAELFAAMAKQAKETASVMPEIRTSFTRPEPQMDYTIDPLEYGVFCCDIGTFAKLCEEQGKQMHEVVKTLQASYEQLFKDETAATKLGEMRATVSDAVKRGRLYAVDTIGRYIISGISVEPLSGHDIKITLPEVETVVTQKNGEEKTDTKLNTNSQTYTKPATSKLPLTKQEHALKLYSYSVVMRDVVYPYMNFTAHDGLNPRSALSECFTLFPRNIYDYIGYLCQNDKPDGNMKIASIASNYNSSLTPSLMNREDDTDEIPGLMFALPPIYQSENYVRSINRGPLAELVLAETPNPARLIAHHCFGLYDNLNNAQLPYDIRPQTQNG